MCAKTDIPAILTLVLATLLPATALAADTHSPFIGFWEAIDSHDGERTVRSIFPSDDGRFRIVASSDYFSTCAAADGRGSLVATGVPEGDVLLARDTRIECADGQVFERLPDEYAYDSETDLLVQTRVGHDRPPFVLHRLSARAEGTAADRAASPQRFTGFWEAIDEHDGGRTVRSIIPQADGSFRISAASEYFSTCADADGKGELTAVAAVEGDTLIATDTRIECADGQVFERLPDEYAYDSETDLLIQTRVGYDRPSFVLHRLGPPAP